MIRILFTLLPVILLSCNNRKGIERDENDGNPVYSVEQDDAAMNKAIVEARTTYDEFLKAFNSGDGNLSRFTVKMRFTHDGRAEHMWVADPFYRNDILHGVLNSDPVYITNMEWGDTLVIDKSKVSDWMYVRNNKLVGGYTIRVLYSKMTREEKRKMVESMGVEIE